jgi:hypothetical protein
MPEPFIAYIHTLESIPWEPGKGRCPKCGSREIRPSCGTADGLLLLCDRCPVEFLDKHLNHWDETHPGDTS